MEDLAKSCGFDIVGAIAAVAEHSIARTYAAGRPDLEDKKTLQDFAQKIKGKLLKGDVSVPNIPGNRPYKKSSSGGIVPKPDKNCTQCGICAANCPTGAIDIKNSSEVDKKKCISCMRCVSVCPNHARKVNTGMVMKAVREDETEYTVEIDDEKLSYTYQGQLLPEDAEKIEFTYKGVSTSLNITVSEFDNSIAMFGEDCLDEDGDPADGWNISSIGNNVVSKATYDAATEEEQAKMRQIGVDDTEGMYLIAEASDWAVSRVFEAQVADFNLLELYDPDYQAMLAVRYRAQSKTGTFSFGLANFYSSWNLGFKTVDVTSYVIADGEWHTMYIDIGLFYGDIDGTLWTDSTISGAVDFTKIAGFAVKCTKESLDIAGVEIKWNGAADAVTLLDSYAPQVTYNGAMTFTFEEGEQAPEFEATAFDNKDGAVEIIVEWPDGAVTDGKLNAGKHTVRLYAKDAAGNESSPYNITVTVTEKETEPPTDGDKEPGGNDNPGGDEPAEKGCFSSVVGSVAGLAVLAVGGAALALRKKRQ